MYSKQAYWIDGMAHDEISFIVRQENIQELHEKKLCTVDFLMILEAHPTSVREDWFDKLDDPVDRLFHRPRRFQDV